MDACGSSSPRNSSSQPRLVAAQVDHEDVAHQQESDGVGASRAAFEEEFTPTFVFTHVLVHCVAFWAIDDEELAQVDEEDEVGQVFRTCSGGCPS